MYLIWIFFERHTYFAYPVPSRCVHCDYEIPGFRLERSLLGYLLGLGPEYPPFENRGSARKRAHQMASLAASVKAMYSASQVGIATVG